MASRAIGRPQDSSTPMKMEQLKEILEAERRICQRLRDNYDLLKTKYTQLQGQHAQLLAKCELGLQQEGQRENQGVEEELREKLRLLEQERKDQNEQLGEFKRQAKAELVAVYQSELDKTREALEMHKTSNAALLIERAKLLSSLETTTQKLRQFKLDTDLQMRNLRTKSETERQELLTRIEALSDVGRRQKLETQLAAAIESSSALARDLADLRQDKAKIESDLWRNSEENEKKMESLALEKNLVEQKLAASENELSNLREEHEKSENEMRTLRRDLISMQKGKMEAETECQRKLLTAANDFRSKIANLEAQIARFNVQDGVVGQQESTDVELKAEVGSLKKMPNFGGEVAEKKARDLLSDLALSDYVAKSEHEEVLSKLREKLSNEREQCEVTVRQAQWERDRLETQLTKSRAKLNELLAKGGVDAESFARTESELANVRKSLAAARKKLTDQKEHYRRLLSRMKKSVRKSQETLLSADALLQNPPRSSNNRGPKSKDGNASAEQLLIRREISRFRNDQEDFGRNLRQTEIRLRRAIVGQGGAESS